jgi:hypothetical protein
MNNVTKELKSKVTYIIKSPLPPLYQRGDIASLWQREVRRDFPNNVVILMNSLVVRRAYIRYL